MNGCAASSSTSVATAATSLAPGFRFHPTDEELVSYYLKRKVAGKPFKVDAISEIDLYKSEPWDLPSKSLIQSRDREWYFFSALDKKYANRSRTNRATEQGYWKTTGKDRPILRNSRAVGMKKTLVFHFGRAPKGERTNWVMHEYRLESEDMVLAGIPQDAYVLCRIFKKSDSGPQNGAQYGAPLIEEEWEEDENRLVQKEESAEDPQLDIGDKEFVQLIDFAENQDMGIQNENANLSGASAEGQYGFDNQLDLGELLDNQHVINSVDANINMPELNDGHNLTSMLENNGQPDQHHSLAIQNDEYVELNDFADLVGDLWNDHNSTNEVGDGSNIPQLNGAEEFFDTMEGNSTLSGQSHMDLTADYREYVELNDFVDPVPGDYSFGGLYDDGMSYLDALSDPPSEQDYLFEMNDFQNPTMADSIGPDMGELLAYFDATDDNSQYTAMNSSVNADSAEPSIISHSPPEVQGGSMPTYHTSPQDSATNGGRGGSTSVELTEIGDRSQVPDDETDSGSNGRLTRRLVRMLGSISSPPAFASEYPMSGAKSVELNPESHSSQSIHFTAGMIKINSLTTTDSQKHWPLQKSGDVGFLLSYGMARNDYVGNSKMHGRTMSLVLRSGCCRLFFSILFLAASFKMGFYIYGN